MNPALKGTTELTLEQAVIRPELMDLRRLSVRLGSNRMLVQASNGNTSMKLDGELWIKASGRWLANALCEDSMVAVRLDDAREAVRTGQDRVVSTGNNSMLRPSIETPMHAVLPHRVVIHVHSLNTIAWAIRRDAEASLKLPLAGLNWCWIPYIGSGIPLAREIQKRMADAPETQVLILGNHGLVICEEDCQRAEALLHEVDQRLAIAPRPCPEADIELLRAVTDSTQLQIPDDASLHALGADPVTVDILRGGTLLPCQATFLGECLSILQPEEIVWRACCQQGNESNSWFLVAEGAGVLFQRQPNRSELATLSALVQVIQRTESRSEVRYLEKDELFNVVSLEAEAYKTSSQKN